MPSLRATREQSRRVGKAYRTATAPRSQMSSCSATQLPKLVAASYMYSGNVANRGEPARGRGGAGRDWPAGRGVGQRRGVIAAVVPAGQWVLR